MKGPKPGMLVYFIKLDSELSRAVAVVEGFKESLFRLKINGLSV